MTNQLPEAIVAAGITAVRLHDTAEAITRRVLAAALNVLAEEADARDALSVSVTTIRELAARVEHPAEEATP